MEIKNLTPRFSVSKQISAGDVPSLMQAGFKSIICNRPDGESSDQTNFKEIEQAAVLQGLSVRYLPVESGKITDEQGRTFAELMDQMPKPILAYCRTGMRSASLWALANAGTVPLSSIIEITGSAGYDIKALTRRVINGGRAPNDTPAVKHDVVIVGGGAAGISVASSLLARSPQLDIAIIDPADVHYYQPGWTMVGAGIFDASFTVRTMGSVLPRGVTWIKSAVAAFEPERSCVVLQNCQDVTYKQLVVCPGLTLDWDSIEGLTDTLGRNGVTSNYRYDLAPYTWELVQKLKAGKAIFTQPPMPIKCAGAPQKAMYLSADYWRKQRVLHHIDIQFCNAGAVLFGVADYVPALMECVKAYGIGLNFGRTLISVDGGAKKANFSQTTADGTKRIITQDFDMIHVVPPQKAPDFIRVSPLADAAGWFDVELDTLRHKNYENIFGLGDATNTTNAKTAAAVRKQAPVVAHNLLTAMGRLKGHAKYDGYGSCPLTVERGKIVLAEFTYGGKVAPSFPKWLIDGTKPSILAWYLKERVLPPLYWDAMLKGREWLAQPQVTN